MTAAAAGAAARVAPADDEVAAAVAALLGAGSGTVALLERRDSAYGSTFPLEDLRLRQSDGRELRLVFKDLGGTPEDGPAAGPRPAFLRDPLREIEVYRRVLGPSALSAPACLGAVVDPAEDRYWLFLERIEGDLLWQVGEVEAWLRAARWLADMHARFADRRRPVGGRLLAYDSGYFRRWPERMRRFLEERGEASAADLDRICAAATAAAEWLDGQPATFLHGEFYPANILVEPGGGAARIRPVDWEMAGWGPGPLDLAALASGTWGEEEREALAESYRSGLPGALRPSARALRAALDRCRLLLAVQWLGWSRHWTPPAQHAHDWLSAALELAARTSGAAGGRPT